MTSLTTATPRSISAKPPRSNALRRIRARGIGTHLLLIAWCIVAVGPVLLIIINSFKTQAGIFQGPLAPPSAKTFTVQGYLDVFSGSNFTLYYFNSIVVALGATIATLIVASLAAFALAEYKIKAAGILAALFLLGIMLPIRLGTVPLLKMMVTWHLFGTRIALIIIYVAMSLPVAIAVLLVYFRTVPTEMKDAARIDGAGEFRVYLIALPMMRPALAAVAAISMLPIWNDLWFPLIVAPDEKTKTVTLAMQKFVGQFATDWSALLAGLTLAAVPVIVLFTLFSKQFIRGISHGFGK